MKVATGSGLHQKEWQQDLSQVLERSGILKPHFQEAQLTAYLSETSYSENMLPVENLPKRCAITDFPQQESFSEAALELCPRGRLQAPASIYQGRSSSEKEL